MIRRHLQAAGQNSGQSLTSHHHVLLQAYPHHWEPPKISTFYVKVFRRGGFFPRACRQPTNPSIWLSTTAMRRMVTPPLLEILELINVRVGITDANVSNFFEEEDMDDEAQLLNNPPHKKLQSPVCNGMVKQLSSPYWSRELTMNSTISSSC